MTAGTIPTALELVLTESLGLGVLTADPDLVVLSWNGWLREHSGLRESEVVGRSLLKLFPGMQKPSIYRSLDACRQSRRSAVLSPLLHTQLLPLESMLNRRKVPMRQHVKLVPFDTGHSQQSGIAIIVADVTETIEHRFEIERLSRLLHGLRRINQIITSALDEETLIEGVCDVLVSDVGYLGACVEVTLPAGKKSAQKGKRSDSGGEGNLPAATRLPIEMEGGEVGLLEVYNGADVRTREGDEATLLAEVASDLSFGLVTLAIRRERIETLERLAEERERLAVTLRSIGDAVITTDAKGDVDFMNEVACELTGWETEEARGQPLEEVFNIVNSETRVRCENPVDKVIREMTVVGLANHTVLLKKGGEEFPIKDSGAPIVGPDNELWGVVLVFRDATAEEEQRRQMEITSRLESLGTLAGGIAHDFNNILTGISGNLSIARWELPKDSEIAEWLEEAERAALRAKGLTQQLLSFATGGTPRREFVAKTASIVREAAKFSLRGASSRLRFSADENLPPILVDKDQLGQVVQNLVMNADQAMPDAGEVLVTLSRGRHPSDKGREYLLLAVEDTGIGFPTHLKERIFDPYYSTKQSGSGLGLSIVHSIVTRHDGQISVESEPGVGTRIEVYLPIWEGSEEEVLEETTRPQFAGSGTVLVMDDNRPVRTVLQRALTKIGFSVVATACGEDALNAFRNRSKDADRFRLVITDLTVPGGMGGIELARKIRENDTETPIIVASGYSDDDALANSESYGFNAVIAKPFTAATLNTAIWQVLGESDEPG